MDLKFGFTLQNLIDDGRVVRDDVENLKVLLKTKLPDEQLALFLMSCDNDQNRAKITIVNYFNIRKMMPSAFADRGFFSERLRKQFRTAAYCTLPKKTSNNCTIMLFKLLDSDYSNFDLESHFKILSMQLDSIAYSDPPDGLIAMFDIEKATLMHLTVARLDLIKTFTNYVQEGLPLKLQEVHMINGGSIITTLFKVVKPFLKNEVKRLINFHDNTIDVGLEKECLPEEFGGVLPPILVHKENTMDTLALMLPYFDTIDRQTREYI